MRPTIVYQPALDGLRGLSVTAVLLFHAGVAGFSGGYLGVSVFFTLSGYLITSLLINEHAGTGRIDLGAFYARRLRRLLPASALCLAIIVALAKFTDWFDRVEGLRNHVLGAVFQVANWVFLAGEGSYQNLLAQESGTASPLEHFWSLAIEEQFYWVWPPFIALLFRRVRSPRRRLEIVAWVALGSLALAPLIALVFGPDAAYWATPARIGEILVGAWLAFVLARRSGLPHPRWRWVAPFALAALAAAVVTFPSAGGPAYHGGLALVALTSGALLVGLQPEGPVRRALSWAPLVALGKISYGAYLFHWPIYVVLDEHRLGFGGAGLLVLRLGATLAVAVASYQFFESPIRHAAGPRLATFGAALATTGAVTYGAVALVPLGLGEYWRTDEATAEAAAIDPADDSPLAPTPEVTPGVTSTPGVPESAPPSVPVGAPPSVSADTAPPSSTPSTWPPSVPPTTPGAAPPNAAAPTADVPPLPALTRPVRILVIGDSTANALGTGIVNWAAGHPELAQAEVRAAPGCGLLLGGERRIGGAIEPVADCDTWVPATVLPEVAELKPDVVVVMVTSWDLIDRRWTGETLLTPFDEEYGAHLYADYSQVIDSVLGAGAGSVALVRQPVPDVWWLHDFTGQSDPARHRVIYELYTQLASERPAARVIDLAGWFTENGLDTDQGARPDGVHVDPAWATALTDDFLGEELIRIALGLPGTWSDTP